MTVRVVHGLTVELCPVFRRLLAAGRKVSVIALAVVQMMIDVSVEVLRSVEPRPRPDEYAAGEPLGPVITVGSAVIRRSLVVSIGANGRRSYAYRNLRRRIMRGNEKKTCGNSH